MKRAELTWFRLGFPRDLSQDATLAVLASLSGVAHGTRLVFDLAATEDGITHRLAVSPAEAAETVTASLHAAVPSLRLTRIAAPTDGYRRRRLWQLAPGHAAIRSDELAAITAGLLASLFPLASDESVRLLWNVYPRGRPPLEVTPEDRRQGRGQAMRRKLTRPGLGASGELRVDAASPARAAGLLRRISAPLWSLSTPFGSLVADSYWWGQLARLLGRRGRYFSVEELAAVIGWPIDSPDIPGLELGASKRLVPTRALSRTGRVLGTSDFAGLTRPVALTETAATRGLYVLGPTGTGKTTLLKNLIRDDLERGMGLAVIETNGDLIRELLDLVPPHRTQDVVFLDPTDSSHAVGYNPFAASPDPSLVADQLGELFQRLWKEYWGPRTGQLAHMGLLTLARRPDSTLPDLPRLYLDADFRTRVLRGLDDPVGLELDWQWFLSLAEREQATVVAPLLNKVRQFTARPSVRAIVGQPSPATSMQALMRERKLLFVHLPKGLIGAETATLLGCLILTGLWQAATERAGLPPSERQPFGLYVDEVQDFAQAPIPWGEMFSQGRKYGLATTVAHQNLDQLPRELREVILANTRSKVVFALSSTDAKVMERLFAPALTAADLQALDAYAVAALVALDDGSTARPVTLMTPNPPRPTGSARAVLEASRRRYASPRAVVENALRARVAEVDDHPPSPVGRKLRGAS